MFMDLVSDPVYAADHVASGLFCQVGPKPWHYVGAVISFMRFYEHAGVQQILRDSPIQSVSLYILSLALSKLSDFNPVR